MQQCKTSLTLSLHLNAVVSYIESHLQIFSRHIHKCHESDKKLTLCTFRTVCNSCIHFGVQFLYYMMESIPPTRAFQFRRKTKNRMGKVKMSCHMQFSPHYIQRYFNTLKAKMEEKRIYNRVAAAMTALLKKMRMETLPQFRVSIISVALNVRWLFIGLSGLILFCWHVYCLRFFDFSCLPFRPFLFELTLNALPSKMHHHSCSVVRSLAG